MDTKSAWNMPYMGDSANLFIEILKYSHNDANLESFSNHLPICQSSGMGKSRMISEVARQVFTIPICLSNDGGKRSPIEDTAARVELNKIMKITDKMERERAFFRFFEVIFCKTHEKLLEMMENTKGTTIMSYTKLASLWRTYLNDGDAKNRKSLFQATTNSHQKTLKENSGDIDNYAERLRSAVLKVVSLLVGLTQEEKPLILISIDEVDSVVPVEHGGTLAKGTMHLPSYLSMMKTLVAEHVPSVMVTILSTFGHVFDIAPTIATISENLKIDVSFLPPIFTELPFDVHFDGINEDRHLEDVCSVDYLSKLGRVLFRAAYENGRRDDLVTFAAQRLANGQVSDSLRLFDDEQKSVNRFGIPNFQTPEVQDAIAAFFNIRFLLYSQTARVLPAIREQNQVASHFFTLWCVPLHRHYMHCVHPPEPILAEAAAQILEVPKNMGEIIEISSMMFDTILTGSNERGSRGEYAARLIVMAAHDRAVSQQTLVPHDQLKYTRPVKVVDFLKSLLKSDHHSTVLELMPKRRTNNAKDLKSEFAEAYVNFTQFMRLDNDVKADYQLAWKGLARSSAIQCYQTQKAVDIIIPILFSDANGDKPLKKESVSAILIQVKNRSRTQPTSVSVNADAINFFPGTNYRSYITILMELGLGPNEVKGPLVSTIESTIGMTLRDTGKSEHKRYHITVNGVKGVHHDQCIFMADHGGPWRAL